MSLLNLYFVTAETATRKTNILYVPSSTYKFTSTAPKAAANGDYVSTASMTKKSRRVTTCTDSLNHALFNMKSDGINEYKGEILDTHHYFPNYK